MADTLLNPIQKKILTLFVKHKEGLSIEEICEKTKNLSISGDELNTFLWELTSLGFLRSEESGHHKKWVITYGGLAILGGDGYPWP